ncbi:MAG: very short patch repair endonuclease [Candidatus Paceibacterota bacterium]|jgi:DNA mismatch endonuclease (patch repair protein)
MTDRITKEQRSKNMSAVRSRGNKTTEIELIKQFRRGKITGWRRNQKIFGIRPDFVFWKQRIAIFVHGCFWHGCKKDKTIPKTNRIFWEKKIENNKKRDRISSEILKKNGWKVMKIWEHDLKKKGFKINFKDIV